MATNIEAVRIEVGDMDPALPILADSTYQYLLDKNNSNIARTSIDAARIILLNLAQRSDETVDIFSIKGSKAAEQYRLALQLFLNNPTLNPLISNCEGWFGGVFNDQMQANDNDLNNNTVKLPSVSYTGIPTGFFTLG